MNTACNRTRCHILKLGAVATASTDEEARVIRNEIAPDQDSTGDEL